MGIINEEIFKDEIWVYLSGFTGYQLSDHGRVKNPRNQIVGNYYSSSAIRDDGKYCNVAIGPLMLIYFGTSKRKHYISTERRKIVLKKQEKKFAWTQESHKKYLLDIWNGVSGETEQFENYFIYGFGKSLETIIFEMNNHVRCQACITIEDKELFKIRWTHNLHDVVTEGYLTLHIIRYFFYKRGFVSGSNIRITNLYQDEIDIFRKVVYLILGYRPVYEISNGFDEEKLEEMAVKKLLHTGRQKMTRRDAKDRMKIKKEDTEEIEFENYDEIVALNYDNFTSHNDDRGTDLSKKVSNLLPYEYTDHRKNQMSKIKLNELFNSVVDKLYPMYSLCEICVEMGGYIATKDTLFNLYKRLDLHWQKEILKEINMDGNYKV